MTRGFLDEVGELVRPHEWQCPPLEYAARRLVSAVFEKRIYRRLFPYHPRFAPQTVLRLARKVNSGSRLFEWGSGFGTVWLARHAKEVVSVEHDAQWYERTTDLLSKNGLTNCTVHYVPPGKPVDVENRILHEEENPSSGEKLKNSQFRDYVRTIDQYPGEYFDCIIVDGRERVACVAHAPPKLAKRGLLVLDDTYRPRYEEAFSQLRDWDRTSYSFGVSRTTVFSRPV